MLIFSQPLQFFFYFLGSWLGPGQIISDLGISFPEFVDVIALEPQSYIVLVHIQIYQVLLSIGLVDMFSFSFEVRVLRTGRKGLSGFESWKRLSFFVASSYLSTIT